MLGVNFLPEQPRYKPNVLVLAVQVLKVPKTPRAGKIPRERPLVIGSLLVMQVPKYRGPAQCRWYLLGPLWLRPPESPAVIASGDSGFMEAPVWRTQAILHAEALCAYSWKPLA